MQCSAREVCARCARRTARTRRGLFLATGNLPARQRESAWLTIGTSLAGRADVDKALTAADRGSIGSLIDASVTALRARLTGKLKGRLGEVQVTGHYMRDVRNYGVHPGEPHDDDREVPFTEAGAARCSCSRHGDTWRRSRKSTRHSAGRPQPTPARRRLRSLPRWCFALPRPQGCAQGSRGRAR